MNAADCQSERQLPDLDTLDVTSLKALVLAKQAELDSRTTEIENLKLQSYVLSTEKLHGGLRQTCYLNGQPSTHTLKASTETVWPDWSSPVMVNECKPQTNPSRFQTTCWY